MKYRIFMIGFGGTIHCPFSLGLTDYTDYDENGSEPLYFDTKEQATKYIREHVTEQNHDYVILPVVAL